MRVSPGPDNKVFVAIRDQSELLSKAEARVIGETLIAHADGVKPTPIDQPVTTAAERT